jgi:hypothetical protein
VFDSDVSVILLNIREDGDVTYYQKGSRRMDTRGVNVLDALDLKVFIDFNASVLFELDLGFFQELSGRANSHSHDDNVSRDTLSTLQFNRSNVIRFFRGCLRRLDRCIQMEFNPLRFMHLLQNNPNLLPKNTFPKIKLTLKSVMKRAIQRNLFHSNDIDIVVLGQGNGNLHANETRANDNDLFLPSAESIDNILCLRHSPQLIDPLEFFEPRQRKHLWTPPRRKHKFIILDNLAILSGHTLRLCINAADLCFHKLNIEIFEGFARAQGNFRGICDESLGEFCPIDGRVGFAGEDGDFAFESEGAEVICGPETGGPSADDDDMRGRVRGTLSCSARCATGILDVVYY